MASSSKTPEGIRTPEESGNITEDRGTDMEVCKEKEDKRDELRDPKWRMDYALKAALRHPSQVWRETDFRYCSGWNLFWSNTEEGRKYRGEYKAKAHPEDWSRIQRIRDRCAKQRRLDQEYAKRRREARAVEKGETSSRFTRGEKFEIKEFYNTKILKRIDSRDLSSDSETSVSTLSGDEQNASRRTQYGPKSEVNQPKQTNREKPRNRPLPEKEQRLEKAHHARSRETGHKACTQEHHARSRKTGHKACTQDNTRRQREESRHRPRDRQVEGAAKSYPRKETPRVDRGKGPSGRKPETSKDDNKEAGKRKREEQGPEDKPRTKKRKEQAMLELFAQQSQQLQRLHKTQQEQMRAMLQSDSE